MAKERRYVNSIEIRTVEKENNELIIEGRPVLYNVEADIGPFVEIISKGAATNALKISDEVVLLNHDGLPLARRSNGSLEASEDDKGIIIRATLNDTSVSRDVHQAIKRGDILQMSFAFTVLKDGEKWTERMIGGKKRIHREITAFKRLYDYSPVTYPAYEETEVWARGIEETLKRMPVQFSDTRKVSVSLLKRKLKLTEEEMKING